MDPFTASIDAAMRGRPRSHRRPSNHLRWWLLPLGGTAAVLLCLIVLGACGSASAHALTPVSAAPAAADTGARACDEARQLRALDWTTTPDIGNRLVIVANLAQVSTAPSLEDAGLTLGVAMLDDTTPGGNGAAVLLALDQLIGACDRAGL